MSRATATATLWQDSLRLFYGYYEGSISISAFQRIHLHTSYANTLCTYDSDY